MATIQVYHEEENKFYQVNVNVNVAILSTDSTGAINYYLTISTNIKKYGGVSFPIFRVQDLTDVAPGYSSPAANFTELIEDYVQYIITTAELGMSSSSSTSSSTSSTSHSTFSSSSSESTSSSNSSSSKTSNSSSSVTWSYSSGSSRSSASSASSATSVSSASSDTSDSSASSDTSDSSESSSSL